MTRLYHQFLQFLAEQREEHIRPEDQEARNKALAREKAQNQHTKKVREIRNSFENARKPHDHGRGPDFSRNMNHDIVFHNNGKTHIRTDLNTGRTEVTHEKDTVKQKKARHDAEVQRQREGMGSHIVDHMKDSDFFGHFETTITPVNKDGTPNNWEAKLVKTDHTTGETKASYKFK